MSATPPIALNWQRQRLIENPAISCERWPQSGLSWRKNPLAEFGPNNGVRLGGSGHAYFRSPRANSLKSELEALGLASALGSPIHQHQIDYSPGASDSQRINQLWLVTYFNEAGLEVVAQAKLINGDYAPLIAADLARLESMMPSARELAKANNIKMHLIKLTNRMDIEDIVP
jgi:hypothetical protein